MKEKIQASNISHFEIAINRSLSSSAGIALYDGTKIQLCKTKGKVARYSSTIGLSLVKAIDKTRGWFIKAWPKLKIKGSHYDCH